MWLEMMLLVSLGVLLGIYFIVLRTGASREREQRFE